jgi:hypothetical protein
MTIHSGNVPPKKPAAGEIWFDRTSNHTFVWTHDRWVKTEGNNYKQVFISKEQIAKMKQELTDISEELGEDEEE